MGATSEPPARDADPAGGLPPRPALADAGRIAKALFISAGLGIAISTLEGRFVDANQAYLDMMGYTLTELRGRGFLSITHPADRAENVDRVDALLAGQVPSFIIDKRYLRRDGTVLWGRANYSVLRGSNDAPQYLAASVEDITERKAAQERLDRSEALLGLAGAAARVAGWAIEVPDGAMYWSDEIRVILDADQHPGGLPPDDVITRYPPAHGARLEAALAACATDGTPFDLELTVTTYAERQIWVRVVGEAQRDDQGEVARIYGAYQDISERIAATTATTQQAALLDAAQDAIMVRDLDHRISFWNASAQRLYGWTREEVLGTSIRERIYDDTSGYDAALAATLTDGSWVGELPQRSRDGTELLVESRWTLVRDAAGQPSSILGINTDVTERRRIEQQFLRAQRMESLGTLAGGVAHDLNNVLAPILLAVELLQEGEHSPEDAGLLEMIRESASRGGQLVGQVLSFARGVEGQRAAIDVPALLHDLRRIVRDTFPKNIALVHEVAIDLTDVVGDRTQLQQVLVNLALNARDALPDGGTLTIRAETVTLDEAEAPGGSAGGYVRIEVEDDGTGMDPAIRDRIFEPFFTTKPHGAGTGLGLSTSAAIVRSHAGLLHVDTTVGTGTRFRLFLPAAGSRTTSPPDASARPPYARGDGRTVLLVEDEAAVRNATRMLLETVGYAVLSATHGAEALTLHAEDPSRVDIVLTDMMMPGMDGPEFVRAIRTRDADLPILAVSGLHDAASTAAAADAGATRFLAKPYSGEELLQMLADMVTDAEPSAAPSS